jgi:ATP-dependent RNA helicase RhlE
MNFNQFELSDSILQSIEIAGYKQASPIQEKAIPVILNQKDIIACAQTGTGKTAAFTLPILELLNRQSYSGNFIKCLVLTPTRELALQIEEETKKFAQRLNIKSLAIFGGVSQNNQVKQLRQGVDILIATPGRLLDLIQQKIINLKSLTHLVLDEADRMLDMGFINDVKKIINIIPAQRQTLLFSATMPKAIQKLAHEILNEPESIVVTPIASTAETIKQSLILVNKKDKPALLTHLVQTKYRYKTLVFTRTKHGADKLTKSLRNAGISCAAIHGDKSQSARQNALSDFKQNTIKILIATDIASRGIDIDALPFVINYDIPNEPETYVHRIGRTGRAGQKGMAISFCDEEEATYVQQIQKLTGKKIFVTAQIKNGRDILNLK